MIQIINSLIEVFSFVILMAAVIAVLELFIHALFSVCAPHSKLKLPFMLVFPAFLGLTLLIGYPMFFEAIMAFTNLNLASIGDWARHGTLHFNGLTNFYRVFTEPPMQETSFLKIFWRTLGWTFINVFFHFVGGMIVALLLNNQIRFRGLYRTLLIIPWAMPQVVAVLAWRGEFHNEFGFINILLGHVIHAAPWLTAVGVGPINWMGDHPFAMSILVNIWLGVPFMAVIILGGLQSISPSYYQAAEIDGANYWSRFWHITLPLLRPVIGPAITMGTIWTFNNITVIYLLTGQAGGTEKADILVSALYKSAFAYFRYGHSAAFAFVIFIMLMVFAVCWMKLSKAFEETY